MTLATLNPDQRAEQRTAEILTAVRSAFAEKGFDGASMQDLARATGMSVGNFYRYFPSKAAIVQQLIANDLAEMERDFSEILTSQQPFDALRKLVRAHILSKQDCADGQIWAEITAAALRKPDIGEATCHMETAIAGFLMHVFARETGLTMADVAQRFAAHAAYIVMLVKSAAMQAPQDKAQRDALNTLILNTIDTTLAEIASAHRKA